MGLWISDIELVVQDWVLYEYYVTNVTGNIGRGCLCWICADGRMRGNCGAFNHWSV